MTLFQYQKEELAAEKAVRDVHKANLKQAKLLWRQSVNYLKRKHPWRVIVKSTADGLWLDEQCAQFYN
jgi:hypothetical protein